MVSAPTRRVWPAACRSVRFLAAAVAGTMLLANCTSSSTSNPAPSATRVLQSVSVMMAADGTATAITSTALSTAGTAAEAITSKQEYSPSEVANDLPVRVLTWYKTDATAGTNLADLKGYTGRVEINVSVENLTVHAENLTYDVGGVSRTQQALVGAPLTLIASTSLDRTAASDVVTQSPTQTDTATNGVLSQTSSGTPVVQWATILAPPQLSANANLRLVVDAKDFTPPAFDISVQPGLVADPSMGALLDSAFADGANSQLEYESRTIKLIADVNTVLGRASETITDLRKNLDTTAQTLGTRSVEDLKASTLSVTRSMQALDSELASINSQLSSSLSSTQSSVLQQLQQTVSAVDQMLGDTSVVPVAPTVTGEGCTASVAVPTESTSVYGNLMQVVSQLDGYSKASVACRTAVQQALLRSVGPDTPSADACKTASATCALYEAETKYQAIVAQLVTDGKAAVAALQPSVMANAMTSYTTLSAAVDEVVAQTSGLTALHPLQTMPESITGLTSRMDALQTGVTDLTNQITLIHTRAVTARASIASMQEQNAALAAQLCGLITKPPTPQLTVEQVEALRSYISSKSCPNPVTGAMTPLTAPAGYPAPMDARLTDQLNAWDAVIAKSDVANTAAETAGAGYYLSQIAADLADLRVKRDALSAAVETGTKDLTAATADLNAKVKKLVTDRNALTSQMTALQAQQDSLAAATEAAFANAAAHAKEGVSAALKTQIRQTAAMAVVDAATLGHMFDQSAAGLSAAAVTIAANGTKVINDSKAKVATSVEAASTAVSDQIRGELEAISQSVTASTRDMTTVTTLLTDDLHRVLLDLGDRKVNGSGLLGAMATSASKAGSADYQLALASGQASAYANVRGENVAGILLGRAQTQAALRAQASLPVFHISVPSDAEHQTVYSFHIEAKK